MAEPTLLVEAVQLSKQFPLRGALPFSARGVVRAVDRVDLAIAPGKSLGLVGESGCGKSTLGRMLLRLIEPNGGTLRFDGTDLLALSPRRLRGFRRRMQIIFQDPYGSLDPYKTVGTSIEEPLRIFRTGNAAARRARVDALLDAVGLKPEDGLRYPHEFSGGQRQRISIARALALEPSFIVCDEPVSALDVSVQAQIINLLKDLQQRLGLSYLFISHDLGVVRHVADEVAVMYLGRIVELASRERLYAAPAHPYTQALFASVPSLDPARRDDSTAIEGDVPSVLEKPVGCAFRSRCPIALPVCASEEPELVALAPFHRVACHAASARPANGIPI